MATRYATYRPASAGASYWSCTTYADMLASSAVPGDHVKVESTGMVYLMVAPEQFELIGNTKQGKRTQWTNFADGVGVALADTAASTTLAGSGLRIHGQGIAETDSGVTVALAADGPIASMTTTDEASHTIVLSYGTNTEGWDPATYGPMEVFAEVAMSSAITLRTFFIGFIGADADALDPVVTGSGTTLTLVQDDVVGLYFDVGLTDADRLYFPHNKANEAASISCSADGVDTGSDFPAAGTYVKLKVRIEPSGNASAWVNGVKVASVGLAASTSVDLNPVLILSSTSAATKTMLVKEFGFTAQA